MAFTTVNLLGGAQGAINSFGNVEPQQIAAGGFDLTRNDPQTIQQPQQQQQQQSVSPTTALRFMDMFQGGGGSAVQGGSSFSGPQTISFSGSGGAGSTASGAGGGGIGAGGILALAALIGSNEEHARRGGHRSGSRSVRTRDQLTGRVLAQDVDERFIPKFAGSDKFGLGGDASAGTNLASGNFSKAFKSFKDDSMARKVFDKDPVAKFLKGLF